MGKELPQIPFRDHEKRYFEWSQQKPPPKVWTDVEKPSMEEGVAFSRTLLKDVGLDSEPNILDMGVGGGKMLGLLKELGFLGSDIAGLDINPKMVDMVRGIYPEIDIRVGDMSNTFVLDELSDKAPFTLITSHMVFNHLNDIQLASSVENIYKLLVDKGCFVGLVPYPNVPAKLALVKDSAAGYWSEEDAPWGGKIIHRHRAFAAYHAFFSCSGFLTNLHSTRVGNFPNRLLILGQKRTEFRARLEEEGRSVETINRYDYLPATMKQRNI